TLHDHVARQVALNPFTPQERLIAGQLAAHLEDTGYLQVNLFDLARTLNVRQADVERVIGILQQFDPPGIFARTLSECLEIQLRQQDRFDPAMAALVANLEMLARGDFQGLKQRCG
ncbi:MAG: RNA polymerase sigma-54 factor, partial [Mesorhizobium sp.]